MNKMIRGLVLVSAFALFACATIVGDSTHTMPVASNPTSAKIEIKDETGLEVFAGETPTTVTLKKSNDTYWGGKTYTVMLSKEGYEPQSFILKAHPNGWYILGNLVFGGLIGWFVVDPLNGKMYSISEKEINATLSQKSTRNDDESDGFKLKFVLISDVPESLRSKMKTLD